MVLGRNLRPPSLKAGLASAAEGVNLNWHMCCRNIRRRHDAEGENEEVRRQAPEDDRDRQVPSFPGRRPSHSDEEESET